MGKIPLVYHDEATMKAVPVLIDDKLFDIASKLMESAVVFEQSSSELLVCKNKQDLSFFVIDESNASRAEIESGEHTYVVTISKLHKDGK